MNGPLLRSARPTSLRAVMLPGLLALSLGLNVYLLFFRGGSAPEEPAATPVSNGPTSAPEAIAETPSPLGEATAAAPATPQLLAVKIKGSVAETFARELGAEQGDVVAAFVSRVFMWKLGLKNDVRPNDEVRLLYALDLETRNVDMPAATYQSTKNQTTYRAYLFRRSGHAWPEYFDETGKSIALRLKDSPLDEYEQITSLLRDRPTHEGMDFKTPVGTPVKAPMRGKILRTNWSVRFNGYCIEMQYDDGTIAKLLHLDRIKSGISPGKLVVAGDVLAESGNTGRSTAPHLHYQLERSNGKVIDPLDYHETYQVQLEGEDLALFKEEISRIDARLAGGQ